MTDPRPAIVITVPRPPSANRMWRTVPGMKRPVLNRDYAEWLQAAGWEARRQAVGMECITCRFDVVLSVPISRRDTDNWAKPLMDLMQHVHIVSNDGNMHRIITEPMERDDCSVALFLRPDLGGVRAEAKARKKTGGPPRKVDRKTLARVSAVRGRVMF